MEYLKKKVPTVLVVDDDEDTLVLIQLRLAAEGFDPICSPNGSRVMDIIHDKHPDLVLLDIHMDGVDGGEICQEIKSNPETASTPIIILSANQNIAAVSRDCGADGYISKPFTAEKFMQTFQEVLVEKQASGSA